MVAPFPLEASVCDRNKCSNETFCFCNLINFQSFFGLTYCGNTGLHTFKRNIYNRILILLYDILLLTSLFVFEYYAFSQEVYKQLFYSSNKKMIMNFIFNISGFAVIAEYLAIKCATFIYGSNLVIAVCDIGPLQKTKQNLKSLAYIYLYLIIMCLSYCFGFTCTFVKMDSNISIFLSQQKNQVLFFFFIGFVYGVTKTSISMMMMFAGFSIRQQLDALAVYIETKEPIDTQEVCVKVLDLRNKLSKLNSMLSLVVFAKVMINSVNISSCICVLADNFSKPEINGVVGSAISLFCFASLLDISVGCYASQIIIDSVDNLCRAIETRLVVMPVIPDCDTKQMNVILSIRKTIRFNANVFDLKSVTILLVINNVTNYATILIQTDDINRG